MGLQPPLTLDPPSGVNGDTFRCVFLGLPSHILSFRRDFFSPPFVPSQQTFHHIKSSLCRLSPANGESHLHEIAILI